MPRLKSGATLRQDLGQVAYEYAADAAVNGFIGTTIMPIFETPVQTANYPVITKESLLALPDTKRASRSAYGRSDWEFDDGTFACKEHGWEEPVDDTEAALYRNFFDAEVVATQRATSILLRNQEKRIADKLTSTTTFGTHNVGVKWDVPATAVPKTDVRDAKVSLFNATGLEANAFICSKTTFENILMTAQFMDATKYTTPALLEVFEIQKKLVAQFLGVEKVLVGNAVYNGGKKGAAFSATLIWPDAKGIVARIATEPMNLKEACIGRTFLWTEDSPQNLVTEQYREDQTRSDVYRVRHNVDEAFVFTGAAYLMSNLK
jgi:hypothetical protein